MKNFSLNEDKFKIFFNNSRFKTILRFFYPVRVILGLSLIIFGVIGIILPGIPGWTPLIIGIAIISPKHGKLFAKWVFDFFNKHIAHRLRLRKY